MALDVPQAFRDGFELIFCFSVRKARREGIDLFFGGAYFGSSGQRAQGIEMQKLARDGLELFAGFGFFVLPGLSSEAVKRSVFAEDVCF